MEIPTLVSLAVVLIVTSVSCGRESKAFSDQHPHSAPLPTLERSLPSDIRCVYRSSGGELWIGSTTSGLFLDTDSGFQRFGVPQGLPSDRIMDIQEDRNGALLVVTSSGVAVRGNGRFNRVPVVRAGSDPLQWRGDTTDVWLFTSGTNDGTYPMRWDGTILHELRLPPSPRAEAFTKQYPTSAYSPYDVYTIHRMRNGHIWVGTSNLGICVFNGTSFSWLYEDDLTTTPEGGSFGIRSILEASNSDIWICSSKYRYRVGSAGAPPSQLQYDRLPGITGMSSPGGYPYVYALSITEDSNAVLWFATYDDGLWQVDGKRSRHFPMIVNGDQTLLYRMIKDRRGTLWLCTQNKGLWTWDGRNVVEYRPHEA